jgi:hypothetical protein
MKQVVWMAVGCLASWLAATALVDHWNELLLGMTGPLVAAGATWLVIERANRQGPAQVTRRLVAAFGIKMLFFGVYVVAVSRVPGLDLVVFAVAFFAYFVALYGVQALLLRGLTAGQAS